MTKYRVLIVEPAYDDDGCPCGNAYSTAIVNSPDDVNKVLCAYPEGRIAHIEEVREKEIVTGNA